METNELTSGPKTQSIVGVFNSVGSAEGAINDLKVAGFTPDSISVVTKEKDEQQALEAASGNRAGEGALIGSLGGGTLGAVIGWLLAGGTALIPGVGPVIAAGIFGATAAGALVGGAIGGIGTALAGQGIPEDEAQEYEEHVREGRTLLTVKASNGQMLGNALDIFDRNEATGVRYYNEGQSGPGQVYSRGSMSTTGPSRGDNVPHISGSDIEVTDNNWKRENMEIDNPKAQSMEPVDTTHTTRVGTSSSSQGVSLDEDNASRVDDRDYGRQHTDSSSPVYKDETYRSGDMADRKDVAPGPGTSQPNSTVNRGTETGQHPGQGSSTYDPESKSTGQGYSGSNSTPGGQK